MANINYPVVAPQRKSNLKILVPILVLLIVLYLLLALYNPEYFAVAPFLYSFNQYLIGFLDALVNGLTFGKVSSFDALFSWTSGIGAIFSANAILVVASIAMLAFCIFALGSKRFQPYKLYLDIGILASILLLASFVLSIVGINITAWAFGLILIGLGVGLTFIKNKYVRIAAGILIAFGVFVLATALFGRDAPEMKIYLEGFGGFIIAAICVYIGIILLSKNFGKLLKSIVKVKRRRTESEIGFWATVTLALKDLVLIVFGLLLFMWSLGFAGDYATRLGQVPGLGFFSALGSMISKINFSIYTILILIGIVTLARFVFVKFIKRGAPAATTPAAGALPAAGPIYGPRPPAEPIELPPEEPQSTAPPEETRPAEEPSRSEEGWTW